MIVGTYRDTMPRVTLELSGPAGQMDVEFTLDTGFNGWLTLPPAVLRQLGVTPSQQVRYRLASGATDTATAGVVGIEWDGNLQQVEVLAYQNEPLLGTALLEEHQITIEATEGGEVVIEPL